MAENSRRRDVLHRGTVGATVRTMMRDTIGEWADLEGVTDIQVVAISAGACTFGSSSTASARSWAMSRPARSMPS